MPGQVSGSSLEFLSPTRQVLLEALKNEGEATTEQLARETFLSPGAVRQHLIALEIQGLVTHMRVREGPGRPRHVFRLTPSGERLFPQLYAEFGNVVLAAIEAEEDAVVERVFERLVARQVEVASESLRSAGRPERLLELRQFLEGYGYFPRLEVLDNGPARLTLGHCPLLSVAKQHPGLCRVECDALTSILPGAVIERSAHRLAGDAVCTYDIHWAADGPSGD